MKILFFTNEYAHPDLPPTGGAGSSIKILAHGMADRGHEVHVFGFSKKKHEFSDKGVTVHFFKKYAKSHPFREATRSLSSKLKFKTFELFFIEQERKYLAHRLKNYVVKHDIQIVESLAFNGYLAFWDNAVPLVVRFRGSRGFWHYYLDKPKDDLKIFMEARTLHVTPYQIAVSNFAAEAVQKIYNVNVTKVIYNGIDHHTFAPKDHIKTIDQSIFYFGTLSTAKGVDLLCEIFNKIVIRFPEASLHIIGRGRDYWDQTCKKILSENAAKSSFYYGSRTAAELSKILQQASVCVLPSKNETFGLVFAEAMASEKAVVAANIPAAREIIDHGKNGFLATTQDDYVQHVIQLFQNSELKNRIGKAARVKVLRNFTQEVLIIKTLAFYTEILEGTNKNIDHKFETKIF